MKSRKWKFCYCICSFSFSMYETISDIYCIKTVPWQCQQIWT